MASPDAHGPTPLRSWLWRRLSRERQRADEAHQRALWLQAELENLRKQAERERGVASQQAVASLLHRVLPILDSLDAASAAAGDRADPGLLLVRGELLRALEGEGLQPLASVGQPFDPLRHDAVQRVTRACARGEQPGLRVEGELRRGYAHRGRVLRPAMVRVVELTAPEPAMAAARTPEEDHE